MIIFKVLLMASFCIYQGAAECTNRDQIQCGTNHYCVDFSSLCNGADSCEDNTDEEPTLCDVWRKTGCGYGGTRLCQRGRGQTCLSPREYCEAPCDDKDERLCQMVEDGRLEPYNEIVLRTNVYFAEVSGEEFLEKVNVTIEHPDCPHLYTRVGDHCLSIFFFGLVNWGEARAFCKMNGGDLLSFQDGFENFYEITRHLHENNITSDFWIGGAVRNKTWTWVDGNPIELGTPYWSLRTNPACNYRNQTISLKKSCNRYLQRPRKPTVGMCTALNFENFFYMSDEDCLAKKSPLCVAGKEPSERA
uniref:LdlrCTL n=1 Tax=Penaeus vannamei TaxID=6689 RepID=A0A385L3L9_PENVA|nr:LdlrCTL [Penaeus vannamei]